MEKIQLNHNQIEKIKKQEAIGNKQLLAVIFIWFITYLNFIIMVINH